eukprot:symbB.v1.2.018055.t1/scaffold1426.1/size119482/4
MKKAWPENHLGKSGAAEKGDLRFREQLREKEIEREKEALPKLQKAREEIELINKESEVLKSRKEVYQEKLEEYNGRLKEVEQEMENNRDICKVYDSELNKIKEDPERIQKQAGFFAGSRH